MSAGQSINILHLLPEAFIQAMLETRSRYSNLEELYNLSYETRISILDLYKLRKLKISLGGVYEAIIRNPGSLKSPGLLRLSGSLGLPPIDFGLGIISPGFLQKFENVVQGVTIKEDNIATIKLDSSIYKVPAYNFGYMEITPDLPAINREVIIDVISVQNKIIVHPADIYFDNKRRTERLYLTQRGNVYIDSYIINRSSIKQSTLTLINKENIGNRIIVQVVVGRSVSLFLCRDGTIFESRSEDVSAPIQIKRENFFDVIDRTMIPMKKTSTKIRKIVSSNNKYGLLANDGSVFILTSNSFATIAYKLNIDSNIDSIIDITFTENKSSTSLLTITSILLLNKDNYLFEYDYLDNQITPIDTASIGQAKITQISGTMGRMILCNNGSVHQITYAEYGGTTTEVELIFESSVNPVIQISANEKYAVFLHKDGSVSVEGILPTRFMRHNMFGIITTSRLIYDAQLADNHKIYKVIAEENDIILIS